MDANQIKPDCSRFDYRSQFSCQEQHQTVSTESRRQVKGVEKCQMSNQASGFMMSQVQNNGEQKKLPCWQQNQRGNCIKYNTTAGHPAGVVNPLCSEKIALQSFLGKSNHFFEATNANRKLPNYNYNISSFHQEKGKLVQYTAENTEAEDEGFGINGGLVEFPKFRTAPHYTQKSMNEKPINPHLVQKVLECQKNQKRAQTPVTKLLNSGKGGWKIGEPSAGQIGFHLEKPEHHLSDTSLNYKMADCKLYDPDITSTGSQKESGYQSGDSTGDRSSATSDSIDLNQTAKWIFVPGPASSGSPNELCEFYFVRGDDFMDSYAKQERLGNLNQALTSLKNAIDMFQKATSIPGISAENMLRIRMKYNMAVLRRRRLEKQTGYSAERSGRCLPYAPGEHRGDMLQNYNSGADCRNKVTNCDGTLIHSQRYGMDRVEAARKMNGINENNGSICYQSWTADDLNDIKLYATLPKQKKIGHSSAAEKPTSVLSVGAAPEFQQQAANCIKPSGVLKSLPTKVIGLPVGGKVIVSNPVAQKPHSSRLQTCDFGSYNIKSNDVSKSSTAKQEHLARF